MKYGQGNTNLCNINDWRDIVIVNFHLDQRLGFYKFNDLLGNFMDTHSKNKFLDKTYDELSNDDQDEFAYAMDNYITEVRKH